MATLDRMDLRLRSLHLLEGQRMAQRLFAHVISARVLAPGRTEGEVDERIALIAQEVFGVRAPLAGRRFVRSGPNTLVGGRWPDRVIGAREVVVLDFEALLAPYETGFARTVAIGDGPERCRLVGDLAVVADAAREAFRADEGITGRELHARIRALAAGAGRTPGAWHAGRLTGTPPATHAETTRPEAFIGPDNDRPLRRTLEEGWRAHWILEIHLVDEVHGHAGVHTELLDLV
ncbi:M24 family metallopeptidase [Streptomyces sp. SPB4]|uniref:M24 family metallopeptidase n=1 Tax=Streptomyces sp. SPB4 TaxID=2940553 RepID=UPI002473FFA7|nr:M24 family metallopeptidase [Streptomyces sp. SPB4]MDH6537651.1 Xaa-Pro aminopeptidase [Streptomyces sp. SPB4]